MDDDQPKKPDPKKPFNQNSGKKQPQKPNPNTGKIALLALLGLGALGGGFYALNKGADKPLPRPKYPQPQPQIDPEAAKEQLKKDSGKATSFKFGKKK